MKIRQTVRYVMKEVFGSIVKEKRASRIDFVMIFLGVDGEPSKRLAPANERVTAREVVGEVIY